MARDHYQKKRQKRPKFKPTRKTTTFSPNKSNPLIPQLSEDVLFRHLSQSDPVAREGALFAASALLGQPTQVAHELIENQEFLNSLIASLKESGHVWNRVRYAAAEVFVSLLEWLDEEGVASLNQNFCLASTCLEALNLGWNEIKSAEANVIDEYMATFHKVFEVLISLSSFQSVSPTILAAFGNSDESTAFSLRIFSFSLAAGLYDQTSLGLQSSPPSITALMTFSTAASFISSVLNNGKGNIIDTSTQIRSKAIETLVMAYQPMISMVHLWTPQHIHHIIQTSHLHSDEDLKAEWKASVGLWLINVVEAIAQFIELANNQISLDSTISNFNIQLKECIHLVISCLSTVQWQLVSDFVDLLESIDVSKGSSVSTVSTAASSPTSSLNFKKGEKFDDSDEVSVSQKAERMLKLLMNQFNFMSKGCRLLESFTGTIDQEINDVYTMITDVSRLQERIVGDLDDIPPTSLPVSFVELLLDPICWSQIVELLKATITTSLNLEKYLPKLLSKGRLCELLISMTEASQNMYHLMASLFASQNIPKQYLQIFQLNDILCGPFTILLSSSDLIRNILQQTGDAKVPINISLALIEFLESIVHISNELIGHTSCPLEDPSYKSDQIQIFISRLGDLIETPVTALIAALATSTKAPTASCEKDEGEDDDALSAWKGREFDDCRNVCQSLWPDIQLQLCALYNSIGLRWKTAEVLKLHMSKTLHLLKEQSVSLIIKAELLDGIFDLFSEEEFDNILVESNVVQALEGINKKIRAASKKIKFKNDAEKFTVVGSCKNLEAFIRYKNETMR